MTSKKKKFVARENHVKMFLCGPTVYDYLHIGHARMLLSHDLMSRYFESKKMRVSKIINITDIDQKIFDKARLSGTAPLELANRFINGLLQDLNSLGISGFALACVSDHVRIAQQLIAKLLKNGSAYSAGGNVYLDTASIFSFGMMAKMSRKDLDDCRLDISPAKKSSSDILLWNASENFDIAFSDTFLGNGIPWWHMQDSSVGMASFGGSYDIHGGASELVYPHHEFHLAQLKSLTSQKNPVRFWTHVGLVRMKGKKMSNSLGNAITIRDLLNRHNQNVLRLCFYSKHYREDFDFVEKDLERFKEIDNTIEVALSMQVRHIGSKLASKFIERIEDDFDTPGALKVLVEAAKLRDTGLQSMVNIFGLRY